MHFKTLFATVVSDSAMLLTFMLCTVIIRVRLFLIHRATYVHFDLKMIKK